MPDSGTLSFLKRPLCSHSQIATDPKRAAGKEETGEEALAGGGLGSVPGGSLQPCLLCTPWPGCQSPGPHLLSPPPYRAGLWDPAVGSRKEAGTSSSA